ncbi:AGAP002382-PA-like protein [Anopheles sinensis]|uniref:AGAP002382-PA-like protein n=1 Tax=Anopheles sinensis TaxID=74873 RepID=A0A084W1M6_ANOSI|nr:AGAP002382-PA-like protein [Anopheles sinensis]
MYPPILVLVLALVSISRQTSALELQEDDVREGDSYSSPYVVSTAGSSATGNLLAYGSTGLVLDEPATVPGDTIGTDASSEMQPPSEAMESVYYQPHPHVKKPSSSEEEGRGSYGGETGASYNSSEVSGGSSVEQYLTTSAIAMDYGTGSLAPSSVERNDSSEQQANVFTDNEARASVPQAFVSEQEEDSEVGEENRMPPYHRVVHPGREEPPAIGSRSLEHHHNHEQPDLPSDTTNLLYNGVDNGDTGNVSNDSSEHPAPAVSRSGVENSVEDTQEDDILQLATTTSVSPASVPFAGTSPDQEGNVDLPPGVNPAHRPTKPSSTGVGIDESKLSKPELLAQLIADKNLRMPIAFLVDTLNDSLALTKKVLEASLAPKSPLDAILLRYNSTGISKSVSFRNTKSLMEAINLLQPSYDRGGSEYYNIMRTSQEIPYDSAIFLATSRATTDANLSRMTALTLLKKRIRLYVIWFGEELMDSKQQLDQPATNQTALHDLAHKTGGRVIHFEIDRYFGSNPLLTTLIAEHELHGSQNIPIGVGEGVNSLYFKLQGHVDQATLETPNGD